MSDVQYREAVASDTPAMARIRTEGGEGEAFQRDRMTRYLAGEHHPHQALLPRVIYVALDGDRLVGYTAGHLTRRFQCDGELQWIFVVPEHRGTGVAAALIRLLAAWFEEQKASRICVNCGEGNPIARRFYTRHGAEPLAKHWLVWDDIRVVRGDR
jgi:GNAT superfamily N-acetyltransferase